VTRHFFPGVTVVNEECFFIRNGKGEFYYGWRETYGEAMWQKDSYGAKLMSRGNANRILRRLKDVKIWGDQTVYKEIVPCATS
jgi:hypothetical protein